MLSPTPTTTGPGMDSARNRWAAWLRRNDSHRYQLGRKAGWDSYVSTGPREPLDRLTRAEFEALDATAQADYTESRMVWNANLPTIRTQQMSAAYQIIDQVMASNRRDADRLRGSVVIDAAPGLGKTTIATRYARDFHRSQYARYGPLTEEGHQRLPVAFVSLGSNMTLKALNRTILEFYGHPAAQSATAARLAALTVDCVISCQTRLIVIDDLHFVDFRHRSGIEVSNHLKWLSNEMPVTFIYTGVQLAERKFFDEGQLGEQAVYAQTARRATRCPVAPFRIDSTPGARAWADLLRSLEAHLCLLDARRGMLTDLAEELFRRTQGHIASLTNLLDRLCYLAITSGEETITASVLARTVGDNAAETSARH